VKEQTIKYYDDVSEKLIQSTRNGDTDVEEIIRSWEKAFREVLCKALSSDYIQEVTSSDKASRCHQH
jgi:hypothetical protein